MPSMPSTRNGPEGRSNPDLFDCESSLSPILSENDEQFLQEVTSTVESASLPRKAARIADNGDLVEDSDGGESTELNTLSTSDALEKAINLPLPEATSQEQEHLKDAAAKTQQIPTPRQPQTWKERWNQWSFVPVTVPKISLITPQIWSSSTKVKDENEEKVAKSKNFRIFGGGTKSVTSEQRDNAEGEREQRDLSSLLHGLDLSSINNRVVGISNDTQKLLESFNVVLRDIIKGGPTAYHDLECLLRDKETQLDKLFKSLPPFLQTLVKSIPVKMYAALAPQLAAAAATETRSADTGVTATGNSLESADDRAKEKKDEKDAAKKKKSYIPSLKNLIGQKGTVAAMLKSIVKFLEMRFPAILTGTNVIMSLAVFILLFIFWYCHKRGKEIRLESESDGVPIDPSLDDLERLTTIEKSAIDLHNAHEDMEALQAAAVPLIQANTADP